jgi:hypothetical protein
LGISWDRSKLMTSGTIKTGLTHLDFNGVSSNGSFVTGNNHAVGNIITLHEGTTVTVTSVGLFGYITLVDGFTVAPSTRTHTATNELVQTSSTGPGIGFRLVLGSANLDIIPNVISLGNIDNSDIEVDINILVGNAPESAAFWHSSNLPSFGPPADFGSSLLSGATLPAGSTSASALAGEITSVAIEATRIRLATVSKSSSGTNPGNGGCVFGSNGTEVAALNTSFTVPSAVLTQVQIQTNHNIQGDTDVDRSNIIAAINAQEALLTSHRNAGVPIAITTCHCSCHSNCHSSRSRR